MCMGMRLVRGLGLAAFLLGGNVFGCAVSGVVAPSIAYAQSSNVVVEGNRRVEAETIRSYFQPGPGGRLDAVQIDQGLKGLYATGLFQDVRIRQAGGKIIVTVVENAVINRIAFEGNKRVKDEQLMAEVQSQPRGTFSRPLVQADTARLVEIYRRTGRFDVTVTPKIIELPNNRVDLVFEINEGVKTGVKTIRFVGNRTYGDQRLKDVIKTSESNFLSFLKNTDIYDADRVEADRDLLRRFYLKNGFADVRIVSASAEFEPGAKGFVVTFTIEEGDRYRFGAVEVQSNVQLVDPESLRRSLRVKSGDYYNAEAVEKSVEEASIEIAKRGYPFASVRPRGDRNFETRTINIVFAVEEGARAYIERINITGNTRTRDYVIRREFDIGEGDAYNRALVDRAERRLKNLNYFKSVKITNEPGSAPDRIVLNVNVVEQPTGDFSIAGGYSTADGWLGEVSIGERNLLGRGQLARASVTYGQYAKGFELSFVEPYLMGQRIALGLDLFGKERTANSYQSYDQRTLGGAVRLGFSLREDLNLQLRYSIYEQKIELPAILNDCIGGPFPITAGSTCVTNGEASIPVRVELAQGSTLTSLVGYSIQYNTLDNNKAPTRGMIADFKQDFAGVGGDTNFIRSTVDTRFYSEWIPDIVNLIRLQAGHIDGWGDQSGQVRMLDSFKMGPNLVRGFASSGIGPRDTTPGYTGDALGGTMYWGASLEFQVPLYFIPKEIGLKGAVFADAGSVWDYKGPTFYPATGETMTFADTNSVRSSVGVGLVWDSPFGPMRFDYSFPITKESYDRVQQFRFGGGTKF
ncbi:MAG: outer membrane protein assembly factor BamA [Pseudorhodoplanes sp.]|nr:outer membrane protein assembly factor BamA [Pseudorhodoplanes sp.]